MGDPRVARDQHAPGRERPGRGARRRGDPHPRPVSLTHRAVLYVGQGCHLCERAREVVAAVRAELPFELEEVDITGVPELEERYREWLPVLELDGRRAFVYHVQADALRRSLGAQAPPQRPPL